MLYRCKRLDRVRTKDAIEYLITVHQIERCGTQNMKEPAFYNFLGSHLIEGVRPVHVRAALAERHACRLTNSALEHDMARTNQSV